MHDHVAGVLKVCLLLAMTALGASAQTKQASEARWREQTFPKDGFAITAPSAPDIHPDRQAEGVTIYAWEFGAEGRGAVHAGAHPGCAQFLPTLKAKTASGDPAVAYSRDIVLNGNPGLEARGRDQAGRQYRERIYCVGAKAFAITGAWPSGSAEPAAITRWLNSFRLISGTE